MPKTPAKKTAAKGFQGFADGEMKFFRRLAKNNDRAWFAEHKAEYEEGWAAPMAELLTELGKKIDGAYPDCDLGEPKVFRIHRDVRFAADKSPYKTNVAGVISARSGKATEAPAAIYVQLGVESFVGAGQYMMDGPTLARFRAAVIEDKRGGELGKIVAGLEKKGFTMGASEELKSAPRGIDPAHPRIALLKKKGLVTSFPPIPDGIVKSREFVDWLVAEAKRVAPLVRWLVFATS